MSTVKKVLVPIVLGLAWAMTSLTTALAQAPSVPADRWVSVRFLLGSWEGTSTGHAGTATVQRRGSSEFAKGENVANLASR